MIHLRLTLRVPVLKRVSISNSELSSQLLITSSECSDSGIHTIGVKNRVGQESFSVEVRLTGTVTYNEALPVYFRLRRDWNLASQDT